MTRFPARLIALALFLGLSPAVFGQSLHTAPIDGIVAVVEEDVILRSELDQATRNIRMRLADRADQLPPDAVLEKQVLERLIMMRLQLQRAEAMGLRVGDIELDQTLARIAQQQGITVDQMRAQLARDGMSYQDFRQQVRDEIVISRLQQNFVQSRVTVSESEIDNALINQSDDQNQIHLGYLLVATPDGATPEQIETARTKIEGIRDLIARGDMDFAAAAMRYSDHQTALEGGDMGWRGMDEIPPLFATVLPAMQKGEVSQPLRGPSGYSLIQLIDSRDQALETLTEYRARGLLVRISDLVSREQAHAKVEALHARIRAGEDFASIAREASDDQITRAQGGDMGWFPLNAWGPAVANVIVALRDGEVSAPFASDVGWHLIQRLETREQDITREAQRNRMRELIVRRKADEEFDRFLRQLRDESYIDDRLGSSS
ncbi:peptidylprolyl isomerase [Xanthomonadaceae bacterium JHOS43]|nr:peptidylprolyl isomerase [Xanthomonadaceae bacterium JHOS43]MCX7562662.1 peptidylprolyl isomerase [Xanthomonadaceae bacterium XH05]